MSNLAADPQAEWSFSEARMIAGNNETFSPVWPLSELNGWDWGLLFICSALGICCVLEYGLNMEKVLSATILDFKRLWKASGSTRRTVQCNFWFRKLGRECWVLLSFRQLDTS